MRVCEEIEGRGWENVSVGVRAYWCVFDSGPFSYARQSLVWIFDVRAACGRITPCPNVSASLTHETLYLS